MSTQRYVSGETPIDLEIFLQIPAPNCRAFAKQANECTALTGSIFFEMDLGNQHC